MNPSLPLKLKFCNHLMELLVCTTVHHLTIGLLSTDHIVRYICCCMGALRMSCGASKAGGKAASWLQKSAKWGLAG